MEDKKKQGQLNIELSEEVAEGIYSNLAISASTNIRNSIRCYFLL